MATDMTQYAPGYSAENMAGLVDQYAKLLQPQVEKASRAVKASTYGAGLGMGSPYQAGLGEVQAQNLANIGQYGQQMGQQALGAQQQGYLQQQQLNAQQAMQNQSLGQQESQFGRSQAQQASQFGQNYGLQSQAQRAQEAQFAQQMGLSLSQFDEMKNQNVLQNALSEAGLTGTYNGNATMQSQQNALQKALAEAGLTGMYGGQQTMAGKAYGQTAQTQADQEALAKKLGFTNVSEMSLASPEDIKARQDAVAKATPSGTVGSEIENGGENPGAGYVKVQEIPHYNMGFYNGSTYKWRKVS